MFESEREAMVRKQLKARGISDAGVLGAMGKIERHLFVNKAERDFAYDDRPVFIGEDQTISQPFMVAIMTQKLALTGIEKILEIGTGSGYQTAILAELGAEVYTVERFASLTKKAENCLRKMGYDNIHFKVGDGTLGWLENQPYDRIIVTAAAPRIPMQLFKQLAGGGKMTVPVGSRFMQELKMVTKEQEGGMKVKTGEGCVFVPLVGKDGWKNG